MIMSLELTIHIAGMEIRGSSQKIACSYSRN